MIKQAKDYDSNGDYVKLWCPELAAIPADAIHTPWKMSQEQQKYYGCIIGKDYPKPIKVMSVWEKHSSRPVGASNKSTENTKERIYPDKKMSKNRQKTLDEYQKGTSSSAGGGWSKK